MVSGPWEEDAMWRPDWEEIPFPEREEEVDPKDSYIEDLYQDIYRILELNKLWNKDGEYTVNGRTYVCPW